MRKKKEKRRLVSSHRDHRFRPFVLHSYGASKLMSQAIASASPTEREKRMVERERLVKVIIWFVSNK